MASASQPSTLAVPRRGQLLKILGVAFGLAVIVGNTIGVGILRTPGDIAARLPSVPWFVGVWIAGGIYALLGALTLAELGAMIPESGGQYVFVRRALGDYPGFVIGWSDWISSSASVSAVTIAMGEYSDVLWPALRGHAAAVAITIVVVLTAIQARGIRAGDLTQQLTSAAKTLVLVGLAVVCLFAGAPAASPSAPPAGFLGAGALVLALQGVIYTYDGWNGLLYFSGEVRNPGRDIPRSMAGGVLTVIGIYLLLNLAFMHLLPLSRMAGEPLVAATAAREIFGLRGDLVVRGILLVSLFSAANAILLIASRLPFALGRDGLMWRGMARVNPGGTPGPSLLASAIVAILLLATGTFDQILALAAFFFVVNYAASFLSVFVLRRVEPDTPRPYRAWGYPWVTGLLLVGSLGFLAGNLIADTRNGLVSLVVLGLSYPVYRLTVLARRAPAGT
ncbi:MAG TPA: APC family permease [Gemmatimonadales bacterium]|nr:APC family permease [Gemmatimonadales bacterium]